MRKFSFDRLRVEYCGRKPGILEAVVVGLTVVILTFGADRVGAQESPSKAPRREIQKKQVSRVSESDVQLARLKLSELGYWVGEDAASLRQAVTAFQKVEGRKRTGRLTADEVEAIRAAKPPEPLENGSAHIEVDLNRQVLFLVEENGAVSCVLSISSGNGKEFTEGGYTRRAVTPVGRFGVFKKFDGVHKSPLGLLYFPNYILGGIAIHGSPSVPAYPASHGCIRIPMFAARKFQETIPMKMPVIVHRDGETDPNKVED